MAKGNGETPLMQQHNAIKQKYPDAILLFRVGDFYETFGNDAVIAANVLGITLTKRNNGNADSSQLAGFPHHALDTYLHKLVKAGYRVAICDQLEDPKQAKGIVKRGVTELVTPGVATNDKLLENNSNNFLAAVHFTATEIGVAFLDISTGEFFVAEGNAEYIDKLLQSLQPAEVLVTKQELAAFKTQFGVGYYTYAMETWLFETTYCTEILLKHFQTQSLKGFGISEMQQAIIAAGAVMHYLKDTEHPNLQHITAIHRIEKGAHLWMDRFTIRNLEVMNSQNEKGLSLLKVLDQTNTPMGARLLRRWLIMPLVQKIKIEERLGTVAFFIKNKNIKSDISTALKNTGDIERLVSKIPNRKINPRDVLSIANGLAQVAFLKQNFSAIDNAYMQVLIDTLNPCTIIANKINNTIDEQAPIVINKGGLIKKGIHEELDELRNIASNSKDYLLQLQQKEALQTGITSLKVAFNNVFGYYLEVTNVHKSKVPDTWIRKQTLANAERYITPELKTYEEKILGAEEKILKIETAIFDELTAALIEYIAPIQTNSNVIAIIDCLINFANCAINYNYVQPILTDSFELDIKESRHPVIEQHLPQGEQYITNDVLLNNEQQIIILTGPNMSGKSALLRQVALITLMAHCGSFVPAAAATIPLTDKIFTRVGASDNLSGGESTFMVEMNETASIINNLSERSLIILDEIGRGTSTYDGISIAWSIVEHLHKCTQAPKTLFATHYHELNELEQMYDGIKNFHITNKEVNNKIIFLRKLAAGGSTHSFGIHVAKMAGMPNTLIARANEILQQLESSREVQENKKGNTPTAQDTSVLKELKTQQKLQLNIFDVHSQTFDEIRNALVDLDINRLTPVEALLKLQEIKGMVKE
jgi:DNA mismatch repair protein MutS